jgi:hypothetical protein
VACCSCCHKTWGSTCGCLSLRGSLRLLTLIRLEYWLIRVCVLSKVSMSSILLMILIPRILWLGKLQACFDMLF